jgi:hypothetical protein
MYYFKFLCFGGSLLLAAASITRAEVLIDNMKSPQVSIYNGVHDKHGTLVPLEAVIQRIQDGGRGLDQKTLDLNQWYDENPAKYDERKTELPAFAASGSFSKRKAEFLIQHSGFVILDIDGLSPNQLADLLALLAQHPSVYFYFVSPSGKGIKILV